MSTNMPTTRESSAACHNSCTVSTMSRLPPSRPPLSRPPVADSDGTSRRSTERTTLPDNVLGVRGPEAMKATHPPIATRVRVPTVASRPTIKRHMAQSPYRSSGFDQIRPEGPYGVKHRRRLGVEPVVAHQHGGRLTAHRPQAVIETPHRQPKVPIDESLVGQPDFELRPQCQAAQAHPVDVIPRETPVAAEAELDAVM